jgi:hypothetical protein
MGLIVHSTLCLLALLVPFLFSPKTNPQVEWVLLNFKKNHMPKKLVNLVNYLDERFTTETFVRAK